MNRPLTTVYDPPLQRLTDPRRLVVRETTDPRLMSKAELLQRLAYLQSIADRQALKAAQHGHNSVAEHQAAVKANVEERAEHVETTASETMPWYAERRRVEAWAREREASKRVVYA